MAVPESVVISIDDNLARSGVLDQAVSAGGESVVAQAEQQSSNELLAALWCVANLVLFAIAQQLFALPAEGNHPAFFGLAVALPVFAFQLARGASAFSAAIKRGEISGDACAVPLSLGLLLGAVLQAFGEGAVLTGVALLESCLVVACLVTILVHAASLVYRRTRASVAALVRERSPMVRRCHRNTVGPQGQSFEREEIVPLAALRVADLVRVNAGEVLPADGTVVQGVALIDERNLSGKADRLVRGVGDTVSGGSSLLQGTLQIQLTAEPSDSTITHPEALLEATYDRSAATREHQNLVQWLVLALAFCAAASAIFWRNQGAPSVRVVEVAVSVALCSLSLLALRVVRDFDALALVKLFWSGVLFSTRQAWQRISSVERLVIAYESESAPVGEAVVTVDILDQRLDEKNLLSVVLSVISSDDAASMSALRGFCAERISGAVIHPIQDLRSYRGGGCSATVQGAEITVGPEELLIERGVSFEPSDVVAVKAHERALYVAVEDEVVMRVVTAPDLGSAGQRALLALRDAGVGVDIYSAESRDTCVSFAAALGLGEERVVPNVGSDILLEKVRSTPDSLVLFGPGASKAVTGEAWVSAGGFDPIRFDYRRWGVLLFPSTLDTVAQAITSARSVVRARRLASWILGASSVLLVLLSFFGLLPPLIVVATAALHLAVVAVLSRLITTDYSGLSRS